jgi:hypothetical protein
MTSVVIRQADSVNHTIFIVLPSCGPFPPENYEIAKRWMDQGLLDKESREIMERLNSK